MWQSPRHTYFEENVLYQKLIIGQVSKNKNFLFGV